MAARGNAPAQYATVRPRPVASRRLAGVEEGGGGLGGVGRACVCEPLHVCMCSGVALTLHVHLNQCKCVCVLGAYPCGTKPFPRLSRETESHVLEALTPPRRPVPRFWATLNRRCLEFLPWFSVCCKATQSPGFHLTRPTPIGSCSGCT